MSKELKQILIDNYKKGNNGKRRNCLGSVENVVNELFSGCENEVDQYTHDRIRTVARDAVEEEWSKNDDPDIMAACDRILSRIESKPQPEDL